MISWWNLTLQFLYLFLCTLHLAEANCVESFYPNRWSPNITLSTLTERIPLINADSFESVIKCTLERKISEKGTESYMDYLKAWFECFTEDEDVTTSNCGEPDGTVSFMDLVCLVANASNTFDRSDVLFAACSHDVVVELYSRFHKTPIAATLPTTKQPPTTTQLTTTTATSTTEEKSSKNSPPPVTTWSTRLSASSTASQSTAEVDAGNNKKYILEEKKKVVVDRAVYSLLGVSLLMNLALAFCVALLCCRSKSNQGTSGRKSVQTNNNGII